MLNNKGFTIIEMVLVIAVVAFTATLAFPTAMEMFDNRRLNEEKASLEELDEIFRLYFWENKEIPAGTSIETFANEVSTTSVLSYQGIVEDAFGNPRHYRSATSSVDFKGAQIQTYYGFIYSTGVDGCIGLEQICAADDISTTLTDVWDAGVEEAFANFEAEEGDFVLKFSTQTDSAEAYDMTIKRLTRLSKALDEYGTLQGYAALSDDTIDVTETLVYFPPSEGVDLNLVYDGSVNDIFNELNAGDLFGGAGGGQEFVTTVNGDAVGGTGDSNDEMERRWSMIALARAIGLPDEYCCHPLGYFEHDGEIYEKAFYYYASPRANLIAITGSCGDSPNAVDRVFLPARITVAEDECGNPS